MKIFITGATGYIGNLLALQLAGEGNFIHALIRDKLKASCLQHKNIQVFFGDLNSSKQVRDAICGCEQVYHIAGQVKPWAKDPTVFYKTNVDGTSNVCEQAILAGIKKLVFTSTTGVIGPTTDGPLHEDSPRIRDFSLDYDRSKKMAEDVVISHVQKGLDAVIVSPSKVFGPGHVSHSLSANTIINVFLRKKITFIPSPGTYDLCFSYVNDVVKGHILAMKKGIAGQKYILGGHNISYYNFFDRIRKLSGIRGRIISVPRSVIKLAGYLQELRYKIIGAPIAFTASSADHAFNNYIFSSEKAIRQLGYTITELDEALIKTIQFLKSTP